MEFSVDPLFKKTSADFDEGGARGLLLNHLSVHESGKIIFDSSDTHADFAISSESRSLESVDVTKLRGNQSIF